MEENFYSIKESWVVEFVKKQDEFIKEKCIEHLKETNKKIRIFKIDEDKLDLIFNLGLDIYLKQK